MGTLIYKKVKASSLIETIIALVIILVVFGIVTSFFVQVSLTSFSLKRIKAIQLIEAYAADTDTNKAFFDEETESEGFVTRREILSGSGDKGITRVKFGIYDIGGALIAQQQRIYLIKK